MKYANFLIFSFLLVSHQLAVCEEYEAAYTCAQMLVYGGEYSDCEDERLDQYCDVVAENLCDRFSDSELLKYQEALLQPEMQKVLEFFQGFCGGSYNFPAVVVNRLVDALHTKKYMLNTHALCLDFNKLAYKQSLEQPEEQFQDYYKQIIEWFFDFEMLQQAILVQQGEYTMAELSEMMNEYGWSEKMMLLSETRMKLALENYYFYCLMLDAFKTSFLGALKEALIESDISAHEIIKIHKFLYSALGRKALAVHKECIEEITEDFLSYVQI